MVAMVSGAFSGTRIFGQGEDTEASLTARGWNDLFVARYEAALSRLTPQEQLIIHLRVELNLSHREIAEELDKPSADAARMAVSRALVQLARQMQDES